MLNKQFEKKQKKRRSWTIYKLRNSQWEVLLRELELKATGATIHDIKQVFGFTKDRVEFWCDHQNDTDETPYWDKKDGKVVTETWKMNDLSKKFYEEAIIQLKKYGYDDITLFIEEI